jgi:hypothetical protein
MREDDAWFGHGSLPLVGRKDLMVMRYVFKTVRLSRARELLEFSRKSADKSRLRIGHEESFGDIVAYTTEKRPQFDHKGIGSALLLFVLFRGTREPSQT